MYLPKTEQEERGERESEPERERERERSSPALTPGRCPVDAPAVAAREQLGVEDLAQGHLISS